MQIKLLEYHSTGVLFGNVADGVEEFVNHNIEQGHLPELKKEVDDWNALAPDLNRPPGEGLSYFQKILLYRTYAGVDSVGQTLFRDKQFSVITDIDIADNTVGGPVLAQGGKYISATSAHWYQIPA